MNTPTFKEQFDKITGAYFRNELDPYNNCACFIGNLLNKNDTWSYFRNALRTKSKDWVCSYSGNGTSVLIGVGTIKMESNSFYTPENILALEENFLNHLEDDDFRSDGGDGISLKATEESIFEAMDSTLDLLRKIHESKGEVIESFDFKQRSLCHS